MTEPADLYVGRRALERKLVTKDNLLDCILAHEEERLGREGQVVARSLGTMLVARGHLTDADIGRILAEEGAPPSRDRGLFVCASCKTRVSVPKGESGPRCPKCRGAMGAMKSAGSALLKAIPLSAKAEKQAEFDRVLAVYLRQKKIIRREPLGQAEILHRNLARFGIEIPLIDIFLRRKLLSWQQGEQLRKMDFSRILGSKSWKEQAVPGYNIVAKIASGGFATLFTADPVFGGDRVAVKLLRPEQARDAASVARFRREAHLMMKFDHPGLVKGFDFGECPPTLYLSMELVEGDPLDRVVREMGSLRPADAVSVTGQAAAALVYMQREGYIHRDVKPENILLDDKGRIKLCDLGFAAEIRERAVGAEEVTLGTAGYISPEQARGELDLKVGADIYSLGLTLYFMLTGRQPFEGSDSETIMADRFSGGIAAPDLGALKAPEPLVAIVKKMLHPDRARRYTTYPELSKALESFKA